MAVINTNLTSLVSQQSMGKSGTALATSMERLASGLRVNSAQDDAAGQAISNRFQAQRTGLGQAARNANDGVSLSQTAQGALGSISDKLQRIRELTVQGLNDTNQTRDSDFIQAEINQNLMEIDRMVEQAEYNGIPLMTGRAGNISLQVGANDGEALGVDLSPPGFSVDALGLTGFNVAGEPGSVTPRDMLFGPADDIVVDDALTEANFPAGAERTLYGLGDVSLAGDHQKEAAAINSYYVSMGGGNFSRVNVSATHETATDLSVVDITDPQPLFRTDFTLDETFISGLSANEKVVRGDDAYYIETNSGGILSYHEAEFEVSFEDTFSPTAVVSKQAEPVANYQAETTFEFGGVVYNLADYANVEYLNAGGMSLSSPRLVEDKDNIGAFYLEFDGGVDPVYSRLSGVRVDDKLDVALSGYTPAGGESFSTMPSFDEGGDTFNPNDFDQVVYDHSGVAVNVTELRQSVDDGSYYAYDSATDSYYAITGALASQELTLTAASQVYSGVDVEQQSASFNSNVIYTPSVTDFSIAASDFVGDDFAEISPGSAELIRRTSDEQWIIRGELNSGGYGYYEADLDVKLNEKGEPVSYTVTATQSSPTVLGIDEHVVDKVHGISTVTIDPRNVSVEYTDIEGRTYSNVLTEGEDGNYYFELPGESSLLGGYKTATLVDHDQKGEIVLRTENGNSQVVVYYSSELEKGVNKAFFVQTDGDGFNDNGTPHTRLRIQEVGEDFRIQIPRNPLAALDKAIGMVDAKRSYLGATENRLASVIEGNQLMATNLAAAQSRIMDADYAVEVANMTRAQILQQAGTSVLAQANQIPQSVLALLG